jgi:hypothetical protein
MTTAVMKPRHKKPKVKKKSRATPVIPMAFGRHETFHIRDGWLAKAIDAISKDTRNLHKVDAHHSLGVGTNMLKAIRYWVEAARLAKTRGKRADEREMRLTSIGELIKKHDPYMDHDGTWWLVHAGLARNKALATTLYWLFNHGPSSRFQLEDLEQSLTEFVSVTPRPPFSNTLRRDLQCLIRTYVGREQIRRRAGDVDPIGCPLGSLSLMRSSEHQGEFQLTSASRPTLDPHVFMAVLTDFIRKSDESARISTTEEVRWGAASPGRIFGMSSDAISEMIDRCKAVFGEGAVTEIRTAGLSNIQLSSTDTERYLKDYFEGLPC